MDPLQGIVFSDWCKLLHQNHFRVSARYWKRLTAVTLISLVNSRIKRKEDRLLGPEFEACEVKAPIFILGHWRSGTTLLHHLLTLGEHFAYPNGFQVTNPHTFLTREKAVLPYLDKMAAEARPMDNVEMNPLSPEEHEWGLITLSLRSPLLAWTFPHRRADYERYLTFRDVPANEIAAWKKGFVYFLQKLTWRYQRTLALKSPADTGRIRLLLEMFPDARFINLVRNPYAVFRSTWNLYRKAISEMHLQAPGDDSIEDQIINWYRIMYDAYFEDLPLIPPGQFCEVRFEDLEADKVNQIGRIYAELKLPGFEEIQPKIAEYAREKAGYQKSAHAQIAPELRNKITAAWHRSFEHWNYPM